MAGRPAAQQPSSSDDSVALSSVRGDGAYACGDWPARQPKQCGADEQDGASRLDGGQAQKETLSTLRLSLSKEPMGFYYRVWVLSISLRCLSQPDDANQQIN